MTILGSPQITNSNDTSQVAVPLDGKKETTRISAGMIPDIKNLYEAKPDHRGRSTWVDKYPDDLEEVAENAETARYALIIRNKKCYDGRKKLQIDSIVVQSPLLKKALRYVLKDYPGITTLLARLTFAAPFEPFIHRWSRLIEVMENEEDPQTKEHISLFYKTLQGELQDDLKARDDFLLHGITTFDECWMIFEPGSMIFNTSGGHKSVIRLSDASYATHNNGLAFRLNCKLIDWDGENFGYKTTVILIFDFGGTTKITNLKAFPLKFHPAIDKVTEELHRRGKAFEHLQGYHFKAYQGTAIGQGPWGPVKYNVDSRIIIDTYGWNLFNPNHQVTLSALGKTKQQLQNVDCGLKDDDHDEWDENNDESQSEVCCDDGDDNEEGLVSHKQAQKKITIRLTEDQLLLCSSSLRGYSLKNKKWLTFSIDSVKDIRWNDGAFESLVLPQDHKELILALTESQREHKDNFDDVIQGKGRGMIMLLSGPPGVGKTLTAESVAETMRAPLYMMSAGDLGLTSSEVEASLSNVLEMCTKWKAVLLLDEADVFLEQRSTHDLERNKLVSIFLRILEYYEGILFLTTNRVENIDPAFQSRIHISMQYANLSPSSRRHVWSNFLSSSSLNTHAVSNQDLDLLERYEMNGREIKNVLKTAKLLASRKEVMLRLEHIEIVLKIGKRHVIHAGEI